MGEYRPDASKACAGTKLPFNGLEYYPTYQLS